MSAGWWVYSSGLYPEGGFLRTRTLFIYMISINSEYLCLIRPFSYKICIQEIMLKEINGFLLTCKPLRTNINGPFISVLYSKLSKIFFLRICIAYLAGVGKIGDLMHYVLFILFYQTMIWFQYLCTLPLFLFWVELVCLEFQHEYVVYVIKVRCVG